MSQNNLIIDTINKVDDSAYELCKSLQYVCTTPVQQNGLTLQYDEVERTPDLYATTVQLNEPSEISLQSVDKPSDVTTTTTATTVQQNESLEKSLQSLQFLDEITEKISEAALQKAIEPVLTWQGYEKVRVIMQKLINILNEKDPMRLLYVKQIEQHFKMMFDNNYNAWKKFLDDLEKSQNSGSYFFFGSTRQVDYETTKAGTGDALETLCVLKRHFEELCTILRGDDKHTQEAWIQGHIALVRGSDRYLQALIYKLVQMMALPLDKDWDLVSIF